MSLLHNLNDLQGRFQSDTNTPNMSNNSDLVISNRRKAEIQDLLSQNRAIVVREVKKQKNHTIKYSAYGAAFMASGFVTMLSLLFPFQPFETIGTIGMGVGVIALIAGAVTAIKEIQEQPSFDIKDKIRKLQNKMLTEYKRQQSVTTIPVKNNKMIGGVASSLADITGLPVTVFRFALLALLPFSGGAIIPIYFILAIILGLSKKQNPPHIS